MTTIQITLPDQLAQQAQRAGLLSPEAIEHLLQEQLQLRRVEALFLAMERMSSVDEPAAMSPEEVALEMQALRTEASLTTTGR